jgi:serine/threonine protein kinase
MAYLHSRGILHLDLVARHILLNESWEPVVGGFWTSRFFDGGLCVEKIAGSPLSMAPELYQDNGYDFSVDVFAFAVILYGIFGPPDALDDGKPPTKSARGLGYRIVHGARYVRLSEIPDYHWNVICRCWKDNPQERPTFIKILKEFHRDHNYILSGADLSSILEYEDRIYSDFGPPNFGTGGN